MQYKIIERELHKMNTKKGIIYATIGFKEVIGFNFKVGEREILGNIEGHLFKLKDYFLFMRGSRRAKILLYGNEVQMDETIIHGNLLYIPLDFLTTTELILLKATDQFKLNLLLDNIFKRLSKLEYISEK